MKDMKTKSTVKYENKIKELTVQCELKAKECYEAWMSLTETSRRMEMIQMELDQVTFKSLTTGMFCRVFQRKYGNQSYTELSQLG
jgi:kinesin family protein C2/C3